MDSGIMDLSKYRFKRAIEELDNAKAMFVDKRFKLALNRSYYAIFHAMRAVNVLDEFDSSKHSGVISHFNRCYVKTGGFPKEVSKIIRNASEMREHADYEDFFVVSYNDAQEQIKDADLFVKYVLEYLKVKKVINETSLNDYNV